MFGHDVNAEGLAETAATVAAAGATMQTRVGDVSARQECVDTVAAAVDAFGKLDVLGNVAGIAQSVHFTDMTEAAYRRMCAVNQDAPFFFCQAAVPHLLETDGNIVNIASNVGLMGQAYTAAYCMTKGAVIQLTRSLAMEYAKTNIRVNAIAPGGTETSLTANFQMPEGIDFDLMVPYMGMRGMGQADDIAACSASSPPTRPPTSTAPSCRATGASPPAELHRAPRQGSVSRAGPGHAGRPAAATTTPRWKMGVAGRSMAYTR